MTINIELACITCFALCVSFVMFNAQSFAGEQPNAYSTPHLIRMHYDLDSALPKMKKYLSSDDKDKQLKGLRMVIRFQERLRNHDKVIALITKLVISDDISISSYAMKDLALIGDESSRNLFKNALNSSLSWKRMFAAFGLLEMPNTHCKAASMSISTLLSLLKTIKYKSRWRKVILGASLHELFLLADRAGLAQPSWNKVLRNHIKSSSTHRIKHKQYEKIFKRIFKKYWHSYVKELSLWWKKHQDEIVKKLYTKKKSKKEKDKEKEHKQKQGGDSQKNQNGKADSSKKRTKNQENSAK